MQSWWRAVIKQRSVTELRCADRLHVQTEKSEAHISSDLPTWISKEYGKATGQGKTKGDLNQSDFSFISLFSPSFHHMPLNSPHLHSSPCPSLFPSLTETHYVTPMNSFPWKLWFFSFRLLGSQDWRYTEFKTVFKKPM